MIQIKVKPHFSTFRRTLSNLYAVYITVSLLLPLTFETSRPDCTKHHVHITAMQVNM